MPDPLTLLNALVIVNSQSDRARAAEDLLRPYLDHFGVPYEVVDLLLTPLPANLSDYPLLILAHDQLDPDGKRLGGLGFNLLREAVQTGSGMVSFDSQLSSLVGMGSHAPMDRVSTSTLTVLGGHPITKPYDSEQLVQLCADMWLAALPDGEVLVRGNGAALLNISFLGEGKIVNWASMDWMHSSILGPLGGLDALLWRSFAWAARKPFCMRGFPPVITMRVDDVAGWGGLWQRSPLYWVEDAIDAGFKPWLGLFIYNLTPSCIDQLRKLILDKDVTAFPHAFGRPNRPNLDAGYYYPGGLPLRADIYDEFIYFDHQRRVPWSDEEAERGLDAVEEWYRLNGPLPMSRVALPHWYEMGSNTCERVFRKWGADIIGKVMDVDLPLVAKVKWPRLGPFRRFEDPGECFNFTPGLRGGRPVYYADFYNLKGCAFFNTVTEIRDDYGYEWAPNNDVQASIQRGIRQVRRALDSLALASLFTHETDFIYKISPENWSEIIRGISSGLSGYNPIYLTLDDASVYLRDVRSSRLRACRLDSQTGEILVTLEGKAEGNTHVYIFRDEGQDLAEQICQIPAFEGFIVTSLSCG